MWFIIATAFIIAALFIAVKLDESMCNTLPMTASLTILTLYILAMFRSMKLIYLLAALSILFCVAVLKVRKVNGIAEKILQPGIITFFILSVVIIILTKDQIFTW